MGGHQLRAYFFILIGAIAAFWVFQDSRQAGSGALSWRAGGNPVGYAVFLFVRLAFVLFGIAEIFFCLHVINDPFAMVADFLHGIGSLIGLR